MAVMQTSTASLVMMGVITVRNCGGADIDRARGDDGGDHYPQ